MNASDNLEGLQSAGIINIADDVKGLQQAGITNLASGEVHGAQMSGIYNRAEHVRGFQLALVNSTKTLSGVQLGLVNKVDTIHSGVSIGLFNFLKENRINELEFCVTNHGTTFLSYRLGSYRFHGVFAISPRLFGGRHFETRFGFGNSTRLHNSLYLQSTLHWNSSNTRSRSSFWNNHISGFRAFHNDNWTTLSSGLAYYLTDRIGFKVIPNINWWRSNSFWSSIRHGEYEFSYDWGVDFGISFKF
jgi:hypothetical protein